MGKPSGAEVGKMTAQGRSEILPQSSPLMKFAIRPRKIPGAATVAMRSQRPSRDVLVLLENQRRARKMPIMPPWLDIPPRVVMKKVSGLDIKSWKL